MNDKQLEVLGKLLIAYCEIEGMKANNMERQYSNRSMEYHEGCFLDVASGIQNLIETLKTTK